MNRQNCEHTKTTDYLNAKLETSKFVLPYNYYKESSLHPSAISLSSANTVGFKRMFLFTIVSAVWMGQDNGAILIAIEANQQDN